MGGLIFEFVRANVMGFSGFWSVRKQFSSVFRVWGRRELLNGLLGAYVITRLANHTAGIRTRVWLGGGAYCNSLTTMSDVAACEPVQGTCNCLPHQSYFDCAVTALCTHSTQRKETPKTQNFIIFHCLQHRKFTKIHQFLLSSTATPLPHTRATISCAPSIAVPYLCHAPSGHADVDIMLDLHHPPVFLKGPNDAVLKQRVRHESSSRSLYSLSNYNRVHGLCPKLLASLAAIFMARLYGYNIAS